MKPFANYRICFTAVPIDQRNVMISQLEALGGKYYPDLMTDVNILVVGNKDTPKYKYCVKNRNDIIFINFKAIPSIYQSWLNDNNQTINNFLEKTFENYSICISRLNPTNSIDLQLEKYPHRTKYVKYLYEFTSLSSFVNNNGGEATDVLRNSININISTELSGKRYQMSNKWNIPTVHPLWIIDSLERGASLPVDDYIITLETTELNGCNIWDQLTKREESKSDKPLKKRIDVWNSIMINNEYKPKQSSWDESEEEEEEPTLTRIESTKLKLFSGLKFLIIGFTNHQIKLLTNVITSNDGEVNTTQENDETITHILIPYNSCLTNSSFKKIPGFYKEKINDRKILIINEWFIERSIFYKKIVHDNWSVPFKSITPSNQPLEICISGFTGIELLHIPKLIELLGFKYCETLNSSKNLLIININLFKKKLISNSQLFNYKSDIINCPTYNDSDKSVSLLSSTNKINAAKKWNIPIVSLSYLWEILSKSNGKKKLILPDLFDLNWCIFAPLNLNKPTTLLEFARNLSGDDFKTQSMPSLPSPRKSIKNLQYGKLSTSSSSINSKLAEAAQNDDPEISINEDPPTQVGYQDLNSVKSNQELLKKLSDDPPKKKRRR